MLTIFISFVGLKPESLLSVVGPSTYGCHQRGHFISFHLIYSHKKWSRGWMEENYSDLRFEFVLNGA